MTELIFINPDGEQTTVMAEDGETIMDTAVTNEIEGIPGECGGACACATCHVYVDEAMFEASGIIGEMEESMLDFNDARKANSRLCCQIKVSPELHGVRLTIPSE